MAQKKPENDAGLLKQYDDLKKKHPDAMLLFREGDFYRMYKEDAVKAAVILGIKAADKMLPSEKTDMKIAEFAHYSLDIYLPKLIRAGARVAICDRLEDPKQKKSEKESTTLSNNKDMTKKSKKQAKTGRTSSGSQKHCQGEACQRTENESKGGNKGGDESRCKSGSQRNSQAGT